MNERTYHLMLVEDSTTQAISLTALLEGEGWKVTWVSSAEKAFSVLRDCQPDLILLDYHLPGIRGDEVCRRIRMNVDSRSLPIVMLTSQEAHQVQGLDSGADDFVAKSTNPEVLLVRLRTLLQKSEAKDRIIAGSQDSFREVHLLAIDDSAIFLEKLKHELAAEGYKVETALDPEEGLERLRAGRFDGVIIDLIMPKVDGFEVCRQVSEWRKKNQFPLVSILLTGAESTDNLSKALDAGADDFVGKSNDFSILKGRIRALLRRKFFAEENNRILQELKHKELEALRERAAKEAAETRAALVEELEAKTEELNRSREELRRASAAKDQFLAMLSHELRTPLTPVLAVVEDRSQDPALPEDVRRDFEMISRNVKLETHLINDLLDLTRITQGKLEVNHDPVDMNRIVTEVVAMCCSAQAVQPKITYRSAGAQAMVIGDAVRLTQVVWNLLQNAIKFTPADGGSIDIRLTQETVGGVPCLALEVQDTGVGIEPEMLGRIFDAFQQESVQTTRMFGGLGLGLAISRAIVERHDGHLRASSGGPNQGSTFRLELPVQDASSMQMPEGNQDDGDKSEVAGQPPEMKERQTWRILLVEDHQDTRDTLARLLRRRGHEVHTAGSVEEAARLSSEAALDILVTDFGLPDGNGIDVFRNVSQKQAVHAIVLSGFGMKEDAQRALDAGFAHHLVKPVEITRLEAALVHG
ncbi:response regulator [Prosthecobacter sp. SYSU 5D2]|uniref:response regulator n=1 Tax=Prosthecobacter sp. SYSU 5D2 TaxID=3134134 RepID=UPI0031FE87A8